jgi:hypothetical protein
LKPSGMPADIMAFRIRLKIRTCHGAASLGAAPGALSVRSVMLLARFHVSWVRSYITVTRETAQT